MRSKRESYTNLTTEDEEYHYPECIAQRWKTYLSF